MFGWLSEASTCARPLRTEGPDLDIALGGLPFEEASVARSTLFTFPPDVPLRTCSAEDLVVLKAFADRPKDWVDIEGILIRQASAMDWDALLDKQSELGRRVVPARALREHHPDELPTRIDPGHRAVRSRMGICAVRAHRPSVSVR